VTRAEAADSRCGQPCIRLLATDAAGHGGLRATHACSAARGRGDRASRSISREPALQCGAGSVEKPAIASQQRTRRGVVAVRTGSQRIGHVLQAPGRDGPGAGARASPAEGCPRGTSSSACRRTYPSIGVRDIRGRHDRGCGKVLTRSRGAPRGHVDLAPWPTSRPTTPPSSGRAPSAGPRPSPPAAPAASPTACVAEGSPQPSGTSHGSDVHAQTPDQQPTAIHAIARLQSRLVDGDP
jgi:hypothetical protein